MDTRRDLDMHIGKQWTLRRTDGQTDRLTDRHLLNMSQRPESCLSPFAQRLVSHRDFVSTLAVYLNVFNNVDH